MLAQILKRFDWVLFFSAFALMLMGLLVLTSASANQPIDYATKQSIWLLLGLPVLLTAALLPPNFWFATSWLLYGSSLLLLLAVKVAGAMGMGAERWLQIGAFRFQPSELGKLALILAVARLLADNRIDLRRPAHIIMAALVALLPMGLVLVQPDLGTALVYAFVLFPMLIRAGLPWPWVLYIVAPIVSALLSQNIFLLLPFIIALGVLLYAAEANMLVTSAVLSVNAGIGFALPMLWGLLKPYQQQRIRIFLDPESDPLGAGYQIIQSKVAIGSGGFSGKGFLQGSQTQLAFLPERHTDFVFSVLGEEFGFLGAVLVLGLFTVLLIRVLTVALRHRNNFCGLVMTGIASLLFFHVLVNVGMTIGVAPVTGLPLPFLTYGGSFTWTNMALVGLLLNFSWHRRDGLT